MNTLLAKTDLGEAFVVKGGQGIGSVNAFKNIRSFITAVLPNVFVVAGLIMLFFIIGAGIGMISSAGNPEAQQKSQGTLTAAITGFLLIIASWWIIQIIETLTGVPIL